MRKIVQLVSHHGMLFALDDQGCLWCGRFSDALDITWTLVPFRG